MKIFSKVSEISYALLHGHPSVHRCRHFSFVVDGNKILKIGFNKSKTHPINLRYRYLNKRGERMSDQVGVHSEMDAVIKLGLSNCAGLTLINTRIDRKGQMAMSKPCRGCTDMLYQLNFSQVYYFENGSFRQLYHI